ncbi:hypothetical protein [Cognatiyoonia sp. IB215182]|uniref:hypothetical protein n=1 Tax=Cognatiyoonia sp. IB215182 TaxID=3097353 RepID=UPI002A0DCC90|nr:hypothetical protein [Cognatiyoonia sp. IB215182]MDX8352774.1 hypothetical protein [Cognatiyoonia sp. IB215182]
MAQQPLSDKAREAEGLSQAEGIAMALAVGWLIAVGLFFWILPPEQPEGAPFDSLRFILMLIAIFMPVGLIWVAAVAARSARIMREESFRVQAAIDGMRQTYLAQAQKAHAEPAVEKHLEAIAQSAKNTETAVSRFASRREVSRIIVPRAAPQTPSDQPALALGTSQEELAPPLESVDLIRALNFPDDEHDMDGFAALRRSLQDRPTRKLVQAAQDVLTLLSQDGIYMDDLRPEPVSAEIWRRFAHGERGRSMDTLGAVRDRAALSLAAGRMREDTIFRDAVHHFLRHFDQLLITFEAEATDTDLLELAETRTARAFMLLGRATGTFD